MVGSEPQVRLGRRQPSVESSECFEVERERLVRLLRHLTGLLYCRGQHAVSHYRGQSLVGPYPEDIISVPITTISTFVLLCSSFAMVQALAATNRNDQRGIKMWLLATAFLGSIFIGFQVFEFNEFRAEGLKIDTNLFGSTFFTLTGFHGAHVTLGIVWLLGLFLVARKGRLGPATAEDVEICGLYWHFVDIVWIVIFTLLYLIGGFDSGPQATGVLIEPSIFGLMA